MAMSSRPSPFRSPSATEFGLSRPQTSDVVGDRKPPPAWPSKTGSLLEPSATTRSSRPSPFRSPMATDGAPGGLVADEYGVGAEKVPLLVPRETELIPAGPQEDAPR